MIRFALLLPLLAAGCRVGNPLPGSGTSPWHDVGCVRKPLGDIVREVHDAIARQGFTVLDHPSRPEMIESDWQVSLSSRWREGVRSRVEAEFVPGDGGGYQVRVRSWLDVNNNALHPMDPAKADWIDAINSEKHRDRVSGPALRLQQVLKLRFFGVNDG